MSRNEANSSDQGPHLDSEEFLLSLPRFAGKEGAGFKPGFDRILSLLEAMGDPDEKYATVHVAGTNGKGSTAAMIAAIASAGGWRCGLHTSPHILSVTERMRVDGIPASEGWLVRQVNIYRSLFEDIQPSFFEATLALSLLYFAQQRVDFAVVEVGLGGRLDATNILQPELAVITHVGLDHQHLLGDSLAEIAREKGGIIKKGIPILSGEMHYEPHRELRQLARERDAPFIHAPEHAEVDILKQKAASTVCDIYLSDEVMEGVTIGLGGVHQVQNGLLAILAARELGLGDAAIREGLSDVRQLAGLQGRLEVLQSDPLVMADVGHNVDAWKASFTHVEALASGRLSVIFGVMADKDISGFSQLCLSSRACVFPVDLPAERALSAEALAATLHDEGVEVRPGLSVKEAYSHFLTEASPGDALLITGSHLVVASLGPE